MRDQRIVRPLPAGEQRMLAEVGVAEFAQAIHELGKGRIAKRGRKRRRRPARRNPGNSASKPKGQPPYGGL